MSDLYDRLLTAGFVHALEGDSGLSKEKRFRNAIAAVNDFMDLVPDEQVNGACVAQSNGRERG